MKSSERRDHAKMLAAYTGMFAVCSILAYGWFIRYDRLFLYKNDGVEQHLSALIYYGRYLRNIITELVDHHRIAVSLWDFCLGYGADVFDTLHYYVIGDPFALLSVFVPQRYTEYLYCGLVLLRSFVCGIAFYFFSTYKGNQKFSSMVGGLNYAFCGYVLYYGVRHPYFINAMIFLPVIMIGIDKIYEKKRPTMFIISVAFAAVSNFYFFYILSILMVLYAVFEYFCIYRRFEWNVVGREFIRFTGYYLVGILAAGFSLIPIICATLTANRFGSKTAISIFYTDIAYYAKLFSGFVTTTNSVGLVFGFLAFSIPAVTLLFMRRKENTLLKIAYIFVFALLSLKVVGTVMNGFSYSSLRYSFILSVLVSYTIAKMLPELMELTRKEKFLIGMISLIYVVFAVMAACYGEVKTSAVTAALTLGLLLVLPERIRRKRVLQGIVLALTCISIAHNAYLYYSEDADNYILISCADSQIDALTTDAQLNMVHALEDDGFYRSEAESYILNTATAVGVPSTSCYYSLINRNLAEFMEQQGNMLSSMGFKVFDLGRRAMLDSVFSVKYYVAEEGKTENLPYGFEECVMTQNGYSVYKNSNWLPFGFTYDAVVSQKAYEELSMLEQQELLLQAAVVPDDYETELRTAEVTQTSRICGYEILDATRLEMDGNKITVKKPNAKLKVRVRNVKNSEVYLCFEGLRFEGGRVKTGKAGFTLTDERQETVTAFTVTNSDNQFYSGVEDYCINAGYQSGEDAELILTFENTGKYSFDQMTFEAQPMDDLAEQVTKLSESTLENLEMDRNRISGEIVLEKPKLLCLSIPYSRGWSMYVDGEKQEALQISTVFTGIELSEGTHHVELRYVTPGLGVGICLSAVGVVLLLVIHRRYGR